MDLDLVVMVGDMRLVVVAEGSSHQVDNAGARHADALAGSGRGSLSSLRHDR